MSERAWHFVGDTLRDGGPVPPDGEWLEHEGKVVLCGSGLHASVDVWDALAYAPGPVLCRVEVDGVIVRGDDELAASRRRILRRVDMTDALRTYARDEARRVMHLWGPPDIVREYLETGREDIRAAARAAACAAACAAARDAAWAAACAAACDVASDARDASAARFRAVVAEHFPGEVVS